MIRINIISYKRDAKLAVAGVRCVRRHLPSSAVLVRDDGSNPIPAEDVKAIRAAGGAYFQTYWPRKGNLRGKECVIGLLEAMEARCADGDVAVKLDADTVLRSDGPIMRMLENGADGFGSCFMGRSFSGLCYGFTGAALRRMLEVAKSSDIGENEPEDIAMGRLAVAAGLKLHLEQPWSKDNPGAYWTAYRWPTMPDVSKYDQFDVVTLGTHVRNIPQWESRMEEVYEKLTTRHPRRK